MGEDDDRKSEQHLPIPTVSGQVLAAFFDELDKLEDMSEVATNFRKLVLQDSVITEPAIRAVLFPDAP